MVSMINCQTKTTEVTCQYINGNVIANSCTVYQRSVSYNYNNDINILLFLYSIHYFPIQKIILLMKRLIYVLRLYDVLFTR